jgi:8-oxo-dGTP pyrophosphatase MutT (NUDIX family)
VARDRFPVVVHLLLIRAGRIYLLHRARTGFLDGYYALPGGHQRAGESVTAAARRECLEEVGFEPDVLQPLCVLPYRAGENQGINIVFEAHGFAAEPFIAEPEHFDSAGWYPMDDLPAPLAPWIPDALRLRESGSWYLEFDGP